MNATARFARLELASAKVSARQMMILAVLITVMAWMSGGKESLAFAAVIPLLPVFFVSYPFLADERGRHDLLYATLPLQRSTVVWGRHLYFVVLEVCAFLIGVAASTAMSLFVGHRISLTITVLVALASATVATLMLAVQLPVLFRLGFTKSRWIVMLPMMIGLSPLLLTQLPGVRERLEGTWSQLFTPDALLSPDLLLTTAAALVAAFVVLWTASALASRSLYARRQF